MTMEEYRQSLANMMQQECQKAKEVNANHEVTEQNEVSSEYELAMDLQKHFPDYTASVTPTQVENINAAFQNGKQFGHQVGFIDTGLLIFKNKGKNGIAFYTSGISERSVSERTDSTISYNMICQSIIRNGQNLLAENKFTLQQGMLTEIVVSNKMLEVLQTVRTSLLEKNRIARSVYHSFYRSLIDKVFEQYQNGNFTGAVEWTKALFAFAESNQANQYRAPKPILIVLYLAQGDFKAALQIVKEAKKTDDSEMYRWIGDDWDHIISEKEKEYHKILSEMYFQEAESHYENQRIEKSLESLRKSLDQCSLEKAWRLYADIILKYADEDNLFLQSDMKRLMSLTPTLELSRIQVEEKEKLDELKTRYQNYVKTLKEQIIEKLHENDMDFFQQNEKRIAGFTDEFGMNALMYAALYQKKEAFDLLSHIAGAQSQHNILGQNVLDIAVLGTVNTGWKGYYSFVSQTDTWYSSRLEQYKSYMLSQADKKKKTSGISSIFETTGEKLREVANNGVGFKRDDAMGKAMDEEKKYQYDLEQHWRTNLRNSWKTIIDTASRPMMDTPEPFAFSEQYVLPDDAPIEEYPAAFQKLYQEKREKYVTKYILNNLEELTEKGEFETTQQYETRKAQHQLDLEDLAKVAKEEFEKIGCLQIREEYLLEINREHEEAYQAYQRKNNEVEKCNQMIQWARTITSYFYHQIQERFTLGGYDADNQRFTINWSGYWNAEATGTLSIPIEIAPRFKAKFNDSGFTTVIDFIDIDTGETKGYVVFESQKYDFTVCQKPLNKISF